MIVESLEWILSRIAACATGTGSYIGRSYVKGLQGSFYEYWFSNKNYNGSHLRQNAEVGQIVELSKNSYWGRTVLEANVVGDVEIPRKGLPALKAHIYNTSTFVQDGYQTQKIKIRLEDDPFLRQYPVLKQAFIDIAREKADREAARKAKEAELERQRKEAEAKLEEEALQRELERIEAERRAEEERLRKEEEEKKAEYAQRIAEAMEKQEKLTQVAQFIRKQASLQKNPILARAQNEIKFSHLFDGTALVITGGPGTGKTTTLIQRLQLLMDVSDLRADWNVRLSDEEAALISRNSGNWMFFSPTEQLRSFLRDNMDYEGLQRIEEKTFVWNDFLKTVVRDNYQLAGSEAPFSLSKKITGRMFSNTLDVVDTFSFFYVERLKNRLLNLSKIVADNFEWKHVGKKVTERCGDAQKCTNIKDLIRLLAELSKLSDLDMGPVLSVRQIIERNQTGIRELSTELLTKLKTTHSELYEKLLLWVEQNYKIKREEELPDGISYDENTERQLYEKVRDVLRKRALMMRDETVKIENLEADLFDMIAEEVNVEGLKTLADSEYFRHYLYPIVRDYETFLLSDIPDAYKVFRRAMLKMESEHWNLSLLGQVVEEKENTLLVSEEQALLVGFINNMVKQIKTQDPTRFENLKHRYAMAYKDLCRPIIGIDEATDYSMVDYYGIASLRHYLRSAVTLSGDTMQCLQNNGITDWNMLRNSSIFRDIDVKELTVSYRQSPKLLDLAKRLYRTVMNKRTAPYTCSLESLSNAPKPLWHESEDEEEKVEWVAKRIEEVQRAYGELPLVAILVRDKNAARDLEEALQEQFEEDGAGIDVVDCSRGDLSSKNPVRIFPIDMVKGMEFQVVFFHNIDEVEHRELIDKYLYVGLSRATFFMAVTTSDTNLSGLADFSDSFDKKGNWEKYKPE